MPIEHDVARRTSLHAENLAFRDLLRAVTEELEPLAATDGDPRVLLDQAMLIRRRLWESKRASER